MYLDDDEAASFNWNDFHSDLGKWGERERKEREERERRRKKDEMRKRKKENSEQVYRPRDSKGNLLFEKWCDGVYMGYGS